MFIIAKKNSKGKPSLLDQSKDEGLNGHSTIPIASISISASRGNRAT